MWTEGWDSARRGGPGRAHPPQPYPPRPATCSCPQCHLQSQLDRAADHPPHQPPQNAAATSNKPAQPTALTSTFTPSRSPRPGSEPGAVLPALLPSRSHWRLQLQDSPIPPLSSPSAPSHEENSAVSGGTDSPDEATGLLLQGQPLPTAEKRLNPILLFLVPTTRRLKHSFTAPECYSCHSGTKPDQAHPRAFWAPAPGGGEGRGTQASLLESTHPPEADLTGTHSRGPGSRGSQI